MKSFLIIIVCVLGISISYGQSEFVDTSFGDNGTVIIDNDPFDYLSALAKDSLGNLYHGQSKFDTTFKFRYYKLSKMDQNGEVEFYNQEVSDQDSTAQFLIQNNIILTYNHVGNSSIVNTYDLEFNHSGRFIIPIRINSSGILVQADGSLIGHSSNTIFYYNKDATLNKNFSDDGLIPLSDLNLPEPNSYYILDLLQNKDGSFFMSTYQDSTYKGFLVKLKADGNLDEEFGENGVSDIGIYGLGSAWSVASILEESQDGHILMQLSIRDSSLYYFPISKANSHTGIIRSNFGNNGILGAAIEINDTTTHSNTSYYIGQLSNGSLLFSSLIRNNSGQLYNRYLHLYNEHGVEELNFGINSKIELNNFPGQRHVSTHLIGNNIYVINADTIIATYNNTEYVTDSKSYITKLDINKLLDFEPLTQSEDELEFKLYPNPITDRTLLDYKGRTLDEIEISFYNIMGQKVNELQVSNLYNYSQVPIKIVDNPGIYLIVVTHKGKIIWSTSVLKSDTN